MRTDRTIYVGGNYPPFVVVCTGMTPFSRLIGSLIVLVLAVTACGEDSEEGSESASGGRSTWNVAIEPQVIVDGLAVPIAAELPVVAEPGPATGEGIIGVST